MMGMDNPPSSTVVTKLFQDSRFMVGGAAVVLYSGRVEGGGGATHLW